MKLRIIVEDEDGNALAETTRELGEGVSFDGENYKKIIEHPREDSLVYETLNQAEDTLNNKL